MVGSSLSTIYISPASSSCKDAGWLDYLSTIYISPASSSFLDSDWMDHLSAVPMMDYIVMLVDGTIRL